MDQSLQLPDETAKEADKLKLILLSKVEVMFLWLVFVIQREIVCVLLVRKLEGL